MSTNKILQPDWPARVQTAREAWTRLQVKPSTDHGEHELGISPYVVCRYEVRRASVHLQGLRVEPEHRCQGKGTRAIEALKDIARTVRKPLTLTFVPEEGSEDRLRRFYKRHGFHFMSDNETMIWRP